jgi:hypothetical protein
MAEKIARGIPSYRAMGEGERVTFWVGPDPPPILDAHLV